MSSKARVLVVSHLRFGWGQVPLFRDLNFELPAGVSLVTGDELSGKTTLLRLLNREIKPDQGEITWLRGPGRSWRVWPEDPALDGISARQWWAERESKDSGFSRPMAEDLADGFELGPHLDKPLYMLSAGSRRKAVLSTAFATQATLTLIDQPFAALDTPSIRFLAELLQEAALHPDRAWLLADYVAPEGVNLTTVIDLELP